MAQLGYYALCEQDFTEVAVINLAHAKALNGHKTDARDCARLAHEYITGRAIVGVAPENLSAPSANVGGSLEPCGPNGDSSRLLQLSARWSCIASSGSRECRIPRGSRTTRLTSPEDP